MRSHKNKLFVVVALHVHLSAWAVIVSGDDVAENSLAPLEENGWSYVGSVVSETLPSSVTYIANDWFITANHVWENEVLSAGLTSITLNDVVYEINTASSVSFGAADLLMFQVTSSVLGLDDMTIASSVEVGDSITMVGSGVDRASELIYWSVDSSQSDAFVWTETERRLSNLSGYKWESSAGVKRWGENTVKEINLSDGDTVFFSAEFDDGEAMGAAYDSGGGVFIGTGDSLELAGVMVSIGTYTDQPGETSVYGDLTYIADLTQYADQINAAVVIPEPATMASLGVSLLGLFAFLYRRFQI